MVWCVAFEAAALASSLRSRALSPPGSAAGLAAFLRASFELMIRFRLDFAVYRQRNRFRGEKATVKRTETGTLSSALARRGTRIRGLASFVGRTRGSELIAEARCAASALASGSIFFRVVRLSPAAPRRREDVNGSRSPASGEMIDR
jgi:hypothetical protein